ncbi:MAG TPA: hypothetical protein VGX00_01825 [Thermoplasmata archaeon]|nr:hypothetical protein [Thermoplasmata archaeon]
MTTNVGLNLRVSIHNTMPNATGIYQQPIRIDSAAFRAWINSNWTNGRVYDATSGNPRYAWIESGASNVSNGTLLWVKMPSISAGGWSNLTVSFGTLTSFDLAATGYMGEAPELSASYGAFDNGAKVFNFYDGFAGTSLGSVWHVRGSWNYSLDKGINLDSTPGQGGGIFTNKTFSYPAVVDAYSNLFESNPAISYTGQGLGYGGCMACTPSNSSAVGWQAQTSLKDGPSPWAARNATHENGTSVFPTQRYAVFTTEAVNRSIAYFLDNYQGLQRLTIGIPFDPVPVIVAQTGWPAGPLTNPFNTTWIRERTYEAQTPTVKVGGIPESAVTFLASGLPWGTSWTVALGQSPATSTGPISFLEPNGTYSYTVGAIAGFNATPSSGSVTVVGAPLNVTVRFTASSSTTYYGVDFTETGLSSSASWVVNLSGTTRTATSSTIGFTEPNGSYSYSVSCGTNYTASPASGKVKVAGSIVAVAITCQNATGGFVPLRMVVFESTGVPGTLEWSVTLTPASSGLRILISTLSITRTAAGGQTITFRASSGTYSYSAQAVGYSPLNGTVSIGSASTLTVAVSFLPPPHSTNGPAPSVLPQFAAFGVAILAIGAVGLAATAYWARSRRVERGRDLVRGIAEIEWTNDGSGEPAPRMNR